MKLEADWLPCTDAPDFSLSSFSKLTPVTLRPLSHGCLRGTAFACSVGDRSAEQANDRSCPLRCAEHFEIEIPNANHIQLEFNVFEKNLPSCSFEFSGPCSQNENEFDSLNG